MLNKFFLLVSFQINFANLYVVFVKSSDILLMLVQALTEVKIEMLKKYVFFLGEIL